MQISYNYKTKRILKFLLAILITSSLFIITYWLVTLFFTVNTLWLLLGLYVVLTTIALSIYGNGDTAIQQWYETQLLSSRELFATMYEQSPVPYITLDDDGSITLCNQAAAHLFKVQIESIVGNVFAQLLSHDDDGKLSVILGTLQAGSSLQRTEAKITASDGEEIWVYLSIFHSARFNQRLVTLIDINAQKLVDKAKSEFVSLATHQLRTPITAIKWNLDLLARSASTQFDEKQHDYLAKAQRNVQRMIALINDFLSVSKLETGTFSTTAVSLTLSEYLGTVLDEYQQTILEKSITITTNFNPPDLRITTDENLFHIIVSNLLSNAVKYTRENAKIDLSYQQQENFVTIVVADSGIGIPAHELDNLFKKFFRASNAQVHRTEGTGLGLYVVKESVEMLGGTIQVQSVENEGTTFTVSLPVKQYLT